MGYNETRSGGVLMRDVRKMEALIRYGLVRRDGEVGRSDVSNEARTTHVTCRPNHGNGPRPSPYEKAAQGAIVIPR